MTLSSGPQLLLDSLNNAVLTVNRQLEVTYANHAAQTLFERSHNQLFHRPISDMLAPDSVDWQRFARAFETSEDFSESEVQLVFADGRFLLADISVTCIELPIGSNLLFEIKQIDQQRRISQETQQFAQQQAARHLIRGLAHEIKNPLGGIRGAAQLLEKELTSPDQREFTQMIIEQSDRLRNLVDRLLGPNSLPNLEWVNLHISLEKIRTLVVADYTHHVKIVRDYDPSIPDVFVDNDMIQQAVLNIVRNGVQALMQSETPDPTITVQTRIERRFTIHGERYPLCAKIRIIDNGPGIPKDIRDTLFYPMVSGTSGGSGLGLSIAQTLIDHHRGKIEVDSWPGQTEFTIYLPIDKKDP